MTVRPEHRTRADRRACSWPRPSRSASGCSTTSRPSCTASARRSALVLAALACGGHVLFEDVPGTARPCSPARSRQHRGRRPVARPVHARPAADRRDRALRLQPEDARVRVPARPAVREHHPRRRDQPRDAEDAVGAARGDGGATGDGRRRHAPAPEAVPRARDREPDRVRGRLPAARSAARPLLPRPASATRARRTSSGSCSTSGTATPSGGCAAVDDGRARRAAARPSRRSTSTSWSTSWIVGSSAPRARCPRSRSARPSAARSRSSAPPAPGRSSTGRELLDAGGRREAVRPRARAPARLLAQLPRRVARPLARRDPDRRLSAVRRAGAPARLLDEVDAAELTFPLVPRWRPVGSAFGRLRAARRGIGSSVAGTRPYRPGDDPSLIDWKLSARLSSLRGEADFVVREDFADEAPRLVVLADRSPSMSLYPAELPWLSKPAALEAVWRVVSTTATRELGLAGYLDTADGEGWFAPRSAFLFDAVATRTGRGRVGRRRRGRRGGVRAVGAEPPLTAGRDVRLRLLRLPLAAATRGVAARARLPLGPRSGDRPGPDLGAELPAGGRARRAVRRSRRTR